MDKLSKFGIVDGSTLGSPTAGNFYEFYDSNNSYAFTRRDSLGVDETYISGSIPIALDNRVIVKTAADFGVIDSTKEYFIDGIIDMTGFTITIPSGGISLRGYNFNISGLVSSEDNHTMFQGTDAGNLSVIDMFFTASGLNSEVFDLIDFNGNKSYEFNGVNFISCTSIGKFNNFRQYLENNTGRFGGTPTLEFINSCGGVVFNNAIVRSLDAGFTGALFEEGTFFSLSSRFRTNANIDLPASASFCDYQPSNFLEPSLFQIREAQFSRNGVIDTTDTNILPNISQNDLASAFSLNKGITNTFEGGVLELTTEAVTTIATAGTFVDVAGTFTGIDLVHFNSGVNGVLQNDGDNPVEFSISGYLVVDGNPNRQLTLRVAIDENNDGTYTMFKDFTQTVNNLQGPNDVAIFIPIGNVELFQGGKLKLQIANNTDTSNVTMESGSKFQINKR